MSWRWMLTRRSAASLQATVAGRCAVCTRVHRIGQRSVRSLSQHHTRLARDAEGVCWRWTHLPLQEHLQARAQLRSIVEIGARRHVHLPRISCRSRNQFPLEFITCRDSLGRASLDYRLHAATSSIGHRMQPLIDCAALQHT